MSLVRRLTETATDLSVASRRQAHRVRLEMELRRLEARIRSELGKLGEDVYGQLHGNLGSLDTSALETRIRSISDLKAEAEVRRSELRSARAQSVNAKVVSTSIDHIDYNATEQAGLGQRARTAARDTAEQPLDEGGAG